MDNIEEWLYKKAKEVDNEVELQDLYTDKFMFGGRFVMDLLKEYHQSKVNSITDEMIDFKANINYPSLDRSHQIAFKRGYRWALKDLNKNS